MRFDLRSLYKKVLHKQIVASQMFNQAQNIM